MKIVRVPNEAMQLLWEIDKSAFIGGVRHGEGGGGEHHPVIWLALPTMSDSCAPAGPNANFSLTRRGSSSLSQFLVGYMSQACSLCNLLSKQAWSIDSMGPIDFE